MTPDFTEQVHFSTRLEGFENKFTEWTTDRVASYINLEAGNYKFYVNARNSDGAESRQTASIQIIKKTYFWQTPLFMILVVLTVVVVIALIITGRVITSENEKKEDRKTFD